MVVTAAVGLAVGVAVSTPNCKASQPDSSKAAAKQSERIGLGGFIAAIPPFRYSLEEFIACGGYRQCTEGLQVQRRVLPSGNRLSLGSSKLRAWPVCAG